MEDTEFEAPSHEEVRTDVRALFRGAIRMTLVLPSAVDEGVEVGRDPGDCRVAVLQAG